MFFQLKPGGTAEVEMMNNSNKMDSFFIRVMRGWITNGQKIQHFAIGCKRNYIEWAEGGRKAFGAGVPIRAGISSRVIARSSWDGVRGATKQSFNIIFAKIVPGDCVRRLLRRGQPARAQGSSQ